MPFKDLFSRHAPAYAAARPTYPERLFDFLASVIPARRRAWDCGTGNGQAAVALVGRLQHVVASDASEAQIANAPRRPGLDFFVATAERAPLRSDSVDLVTAAQALHWFDIPAFFAEAERVTVRDGIVAAWGYNLLSVEPDVDREIRTLYARTLGAYWSPERRLVDDEYRSVPFPFDELPAPPLDIELEWSLPELAAYLRTWSACISYREREGLDPVDGVIERVHGPWGDPQRRRTIRWPIHMRVGRVR
jgi:hypothetical protein